MASLFIRTFCIALELLLICFIFGLLVDHVERILTGVVGIDGGELVEVPPETAVVIGDKANPTVGASIKLGGRAFLFPPSSFSWARRTAICFPALLLSVSGNLHARIASGTVEFGQRNR